jgi:hypothetical protein
MRRPVVHARAVVSVFIAVLFPALSVSAQSVRGSVSDAGSVPVPGVLVQLIGADSSIAARVLTNERGQFLIAAPRAGTYRVRTLRIGFKPVLSEPITLATGQEVPQQIALASISLGLDTVKVGGRATCGRSDAGNMTLAIWEQARAALSATAISGGMRGLFTRRLTWDQLLDNAGFRTVSQSTQIETDPVAQPWVSEPPESLHQFGYIVEIMDSTAYRAPGLEALASPSFFGDHCFRLANAKDKADIAIEFEPTTERRKLADIRGVVTMDRATAQLRSIEFRYVNPENRDTEAGARGTVEFARLANGTWAIAKWNIRMPILELARGNARAGADTRVRVANVRSMGGELALAVAGGDTLFSRLPLVLNGTVQDSLTGRDLAGVRVTLQGTGLEATSDSRGRFAISGVLPGEYDLAVHTPGLDSLGTVSEKLVSITDAKESVRIRVPTSAMIVRSICGNRERAGIPGIITGAVAKPDGGRLPANTKVSLEWTDRESGSLRAVPVPTDTEGNFRLCGVPTATSVTLRAAADSIRATPVIFVLAAEKPIESFLVDLTVTANATASLAGTVVVDSGGAPIAGVEVLLPALTLTAQSDARGVFRVSDIPPGAHRIVARKPGYGPLDATVSFSANETVNRRLVLSRVTELNKVTITADRGMREFEVHKATGLGTFLTRDFLQTMEGSELGMVMYTLPGIKMYPPGGRKTAITNNRVCLPDFASQTCIPCFALVILDGIVLNPTGRPFNINEIPVREIEAIEHYPNSILVPPRYAHLATRCGIVVIHTLRTLPPLKGAKP